MSYLDQINFFNRYTETIESVSGRAQLLWFKLMHCANRSGWPEWFEVGQGTLMELCELTRKQYFFEARDELKEKGFIQFKKGRKGVKAKYHINPLIEENYQIRLDNNSSFNSVNNEPDCVSRSGSEEHKNGSFNSVEDKTNCVSRSEPNSVSSSVPDVVPNPVPNNVPNAVPNKTISSLENYIYKDIDIDKDIDINIDSTSVESLSSNEDEKANQNNLNIKSLIDFWNKHSGNMPKLRSLNGKRLKMVKARIREYDKKSFKEAILLAEQSDYLNGSGRNGWTANFDWIIKPNNFPKVLEGNYNNFQNSLKNSDKNFNNGEIGKAEELEYGIFEEFRKKREKE